MAKENVKTRKNQRTIGSSEAHGPTISDNVTKALEECVRIMVSNLPPSSRQKNKSGIKRPMNSFMVYSQTARKAMARCYPSLSYQKLSKALGKIWKVLDDEEKKPFKKEAERLRQKHKEDHPDYKFKPIKARKTRAVKVVSEKQCVPTAEDLVQLISADRAVIKPSCEQNLSSTFGQVPTAFERNPFLQPTSIAQLRQSPNSVSPNSDLNDHTYVDENLRLKDDLLSLLENFLDASQNLSQHAISSTPQYSLRQFDTVNPREHLPMGNFVNSFPNNQRNEHVNDLIPQCNASADVFSHFFNGNGQSCATSAEIGKLGSDFENFCQFITDDKALSSTPNSPSHQIDFNDSSRVIVNL